MSGIKTVRKHVETNKRKTAAGTRCVDGGYTEAQAAGSTAFAGADLGLSMALLSFDEITPEVAFAIVHDYKQSIGEIYTWHTDIHHPDGAKGCGCGHCNASLEPKNSNYYGVTTDESAELLSIVQKATKTGSAQVVILDRNHEEQDIIIVEGDIWTVNPKNDETGEQHYIYDKTRHITLLKNLSVYIRSQDVPTIQAEELIDISEKQTNATLSLLETSRGAEIFVVRFSQEGIPYIQFQGKAPDAALSR